MIAQEIAHLLPSAVYEGGNFVIPTTGETVENLLVVNERMLLLENIGATQYPCSRTQCECFGMP